MEGNGKTQGRGKKREVMSLSSFHLLSFSLKGKKNEGRTCNSVLSIVLTRVAECSDDATMGGGGSSLGGSSNICSCCLFIVPGRVHTKDGRKRRSGKDKGSRNNTQKE